MARSWLILRSVHQVAAVAGKFTSRSEGSSTSSAERCPVSILSLADMLRTAEAGGFLKLTAGLPWRP